MSGLLGLLEKATPDECCEFTIGSSQSESSSKGCHWRSENLARDRLHCCSRVIADITKNLDLLLRQGFFIHLSRLERNALIEDEAPPSLRASTSGSPTSGDPRGAERAVAAPTCYSPATSRRRKRTKAAASGTAMKIAETQIARMTGVQ